MSRRFRLVDVFGERPLTGNPLAVVIDSEGLETGEMLELTRWLGYSETTFLSPPVAEEADYGVRIFSPGGELPFAGHPTLGTCHVWHGLADAPGAEMLQECGAGLVRLRWIEDRLSFQGPDLVRDGPIEPEDLRAIIAVLGIDPSSVLAGRWVDNGPGWAGLLLRSADEVLAITPDFARDDSGRAHAIGVVGMRPAGSDARYEVRAFFPDQNGRTREDPVTGSLNASLARWLLDQDMVDAPYIASQGTALGRSGRVHISTDESGGVWVGGHVFDVATGSI